MEEAKKWWRNLSEKTKWNLTINHLAHWEDLTDDEILKLYQDNGV
tara:strand:+ start:327 stop:461 length:135 start_codon:yes stop_codon:yes gene_type:complete